MLCILFISILIPYWNILNKINTNYDTIIKALNLNVLWYCHKILRILGERYILKRMIYLRINYSIDVDKDR